MKTKSISIAEIARIANVNPSTVSRALNGSPLVKEETRIWIQEIAREHGYIPDAVAKSLSKGKTLTIGVIVSEISNSFYSHIVDALEQIMVEHGYSLIICGTRFDTDAELRAIRTMLSKRVDGLVLCSPSKAGEELLMQMSGNTPVVLGDTIVQNECFSSVYVDQEVGICALIEHLLERGHREIGCITDRVCLHRAEHFVSLLGRYGLQMKKEHLFYGDEIGVKVGYEGFHAMCRRGELPTALFAARDSIAVGVMRSAIEQNIEIPEQLAVIGYDGISISDYLNKKLTTVRQPASEIGENIAKLLLEEMAGGANGKKPTTISLIPELVVRETT